MRCIVSVMRGYWRGVVLGGEWLVSSRGCGDPAEVSRCTVVVVVVVGDNEFDVLAKICPGLVRMVGLTISLCEDGVGCVD